MFDRITYKIIVALCFFLAWIHTLNQMHKLESGNTKLFRSPSLWSDKVDQMVRFAPSSISSYALMDLPFLICRYL